MPYWWKHPFRVAVAFLIFSFVFCSPSLPAASDPAGGEASVRGKFLVPTAELPFEPARVGLELLWTQNVPGGEDHPALTNVFPAQDSLLVQTYDANLLSLERESGAWLGGISLHTQIGEPPVVRGNRVLAIVQGNLLRMDLEEGDVEVEFRVNLVPSAPYILHQGLLLVPTEMGEVVAVDPENGEQEWTFTPGGSVRGALVVDGQIVYAAAYQGGVMAANVRDGEILWTWEPSNSVVCSCIPEARNGRIYVGDTNGFVHCLDGDIGLPYWRYPAGSPIERCVGLAGQRLLVTTHRGDTLCLSSGDSTDLLWTHPGPDTFLVQGDDKVYLLAEEENALCAVSLDDGEELWRRKLPADMMVRGGPNQGQLHMFTPAGKVIALSEAE